MAETRFHINYGNGIDDYFVADGPPHRAEQRLLDCLEEVDKAIGFTQTDIIVSVCHGKKEAACAVRRWVSVPLTADLAEIYNDASECIQFGELGYYEPWMLL